MKKRVIILLSFAGVLAPAATPPPTVVTDAEGPSSFSPSSPVGILKPTPRAGVPATPPKRVTFAADTVDASPTTDAARAVLARPFTPVSSFAFLPAFMFKTGSIGFGVAFAARACLRVQRALAERNEQRGYEGLSSMTLREYLLEQFCTAPLTQKAQYAALTCAVAGAIWWSWSHTTPSL